MRSLAPALLLALLLAAGEAAAGSAPPTAAIELDAPAWSIAYADGVTAGLAAIPATLGLAVWLNSLTSNVLLAALPSLLIVAALPPLAMTAAEWWLHDSPEGQASFSPAIWVAIGMHLAVVTAAILFGVSIRDLDEAVAFTVVDALAVPAAVTFTMHLTRPPPPGPPLVPDGGHGASCEPTAVLPLVRLSF